MKTKGFKPSATIPINKNLKMLIQSHNDSSYEDDDDDDDSLEIYESATDDSQSSQIHENVNINENDEYKFKEEKLINNNNSNSSKRSTNAKTEDYKLLFKVNNKNYDASSVNVLGEEAEEEEEEQEEEESEEDKKKSIQIDSCYDKNKENDGKTIKKRRRKSKYSPSICVTNSRYTLISRVAKSIGWRLVNENHLWNIFWTDSFHSVEIYKDMKRFQKINHFPGMVEICRKDLLARNLNRMMKLFPNEYNIFPKTWVFPADLGDAISYSKGKNKTFIIKPDQGSQGKGIWLTKTLKEIKPTERMICQTYITKPLLVDGYKFDLRIYTLITSIDPLRVFVYNEGLARFATSKYKEPTGHNTTNMYMHLTNYSLNKHSQTFCKDDEAGSKRKFSTVNKILLNNGHDIEKLWHNIDDIIIKTILSAWPMLKHNYNACFPQHDITQACFEILGFDILVDNKLKPYILEVNHSPSFHTEENIDKEVKEALIRDTFNLLNISMLDKRKVLTEDKKRVKRRLLKCIRDHQRYFSGIQNESISEEQKDNNNNNDSLMKQIEWEESHLSGFRRIMPAPNDPNKYTPFFILQSQASLYCDTAASKRREEAAKELRSALIEKAKKNRQILDSKLSRKQALIEHNKTATARKRKKDKMMLRIKWSAGNLISDAEERERLLLLSQRDNLVKNSGIFQMIYESFYRNKLLSESDRKKHKDLFHKLETNKNSQKETTINAFDPFSQFSQYSTYKRTKNNNNNHNNCLIKQHIQNIPKSTIIKYPDFREVHFKNTVNLSQCCYNTTNYERNRPDIGLQNLDVRKCLF